MSEHNDVLQVQGVNSKGFGTVPKLVMQDRRLTPQAKAIYAYFCSYAGAGKTAFPGRAKIIADIGISKDSYYKHFNALKEHGYIKVEQEKDKAGHFRRNIYTITDFLPCPKKPDTVKTHTAPCPNLPDTGLPDTVKQDTNINRFKNKQSLNINSEGESAPARNTYGEFQQVCMTTGQHDALITAYGRDKGTDYIARLDRHIASTGKQYKGHYATIQKWIAQDAAKDKPANKPPKSNRFANFTQREWDYGAIERAEQQNLLSGKEQQT